MTSDEYKNGVRDQKIAELEAKVERLWKIVATIGGALAVQWAKVMGIWL